MPIYGNMQMSRLNPANQQRGINPTLGIGQNRSRDCFSQPISDEYFKRGVAYIWATIFPLEGIPILVVVIMIVVVLGAFACLIRWRKYLLLRRQIDECMNDVFVQHQHRVRS